MRLFRDHIGLGSWLALIALALNLVLSFGHIHGVVGHERNVLLVGVVPSDSGQTGHHDGLANDQCPICMAAAAMGNAFASAPPMLLHPTVDLLIDRAVDPTYAFAEQPRAAFEPRAPPIS